MYLLIMSIYLTDCRPAASLLLSRGRGFVFLRFWTFFRV